MPFSPQQSPSLWCNIFTLLYTLKSNYGAPPLPQISGFSMSNWRQTGQAALQQLAPWLQKAMSGVDFHWLFFVLIWIAAYPSVWAVVIIGRRSLWSGTEEVDMDQEEEVVKAVEDERKALEEEKKAAEKAAIAAARKEAVQKIAAERDQAPAPTPAPAPAQNGTNGTNGVHVEEEELWEVIGGVDKGGIMVREGESTTSTQKSDRLSTGALVEQLALKGDRLHYKLRKGTGPEEGWVSIKLTGKDLVVPWVEMGENGPKRRPPAWKVVKQPQIEFGQMKEVASKNDPGDYYGIKFPYTKDMIVEMGPEWLTQAFHKSGVLPRDNAVTKISDAKEFIGGGAGLKCTFTVEYKKDEPYLHKKLFCKLPHKPGTSDRYFVSCMWNHDRPEIVFNIYLQESVSFRVPKFYFGDISAATTNFVLITESIPWAETGKKDFSPGEIEPAYDKYKDWELPDGGPMYYLACCRALGKMAGYHKQKRLHKSVDDTEMFPMPDPMPRELPKTLPALDPLAKKQNLAKVDQWPGRTRPGWGWG
ncbi:unnamed protein product [Cladocopium goreaui]|uniref:E3 ubiquitin-protein ligase HERC2 n=1 Tax=Cladocopium goreaui TaxID=2562237 RepID=A0A9P1G1C3_9DINO|nr:unnamed protein product [Cladocopium goreaui]